MSVMQPRVRGVRDRRPNRRPAYFERRDVEADSDSESDDDDKLQSVDDDSDDDDDDDDKNKGITGNAAATTPIIGISTTAAPTLEVTLASPSPSLSLESSLPPPSSSPSPTGPAQSIASEPSSASIAPSSVASSVAQTKTTPTTFSTILPVPSAQNDSPSSSEVSQAPIPRVSSTSTIPADGDSQKDSTLVLASDNRSQAVGIAMGTISAVIILVILAYFLIRRKRRAAQNVLDPQPNHGPRRHAPSMVWTLWGSSPSSRSGRTTTRSPGNRTNSDIIDEMVRTAYAAEEGGNFMEGGFAADEKRNFAAFPREPPAARRKKPRTISAWIRGLMTPSTAMSADREPHWERHLSLATRPLSSPGLSSAPTLETLSSVSGNRLAPFVPMHEDSAPGVSRPAATRMGGSGRE